MFRYPVPCTYTQIFELIRVNFFPFLLFRLFKGEQGKGHPLFYPNSRLPSSSPMYPIRSLSGAGQSTRRQSGLSKVLEPTKKVTCLI
jgi:hypothetical protein